MDGCLVLEKLHPILMTGGIMPDMQTGKARMGGLIGFLWLEQVKSVIGDLLFCGHELLQQFYTINHLPCD